MYIKLTTGIAGVCNNFNLSSTCELLSHPVTHLLIVLLSSASLGLLSYVIGLLSNHESMSLERMFSMLKMLFAGTGEDMLNRIDMNIVMLRKFLAGMVETEKIDLIDNVYRVHNKRNM